MTKGYLYIYIFLVWTSCNPVPVYTSNDGPLFSYHPEQVSDVSSKEPVVCSYNIEYAMHVDQAISDLSDIPFDLLILQEMDEKGTEHIARHFQMHSIYYPISIEREEGKLYGCSVLSSTPILRHEKIVLPHKQPLNFRKRSATYAEVIRNDKRIGVYSIHLETFIMPRADRIDQLLYLLQDAESREHLDGIIFGGDFNSLFIHDVQEMVDICTAYGYTHATSSLLKKPHEQDYRKVTALDHIFLKNIRSTLAEAALHASASDHFPIWCTLKI